MARIPRIHTALFIQMSGTRRPRVWRQSTVASDFTLGPDPSNPSGNRATLLWGMPPECTPRLRIDRTVAAVVSRPITRVVATLRVTPRVSPAADSLGLGSCDLGSSLISPAQLGHLVQLLARRTYTPSEVRLIYSQLGEP